MISDGFNGGCRVGVRESESRPSSMDNEARSSLQAGQSLCFSRVVPLSANLIQTLKDIYQKCLLTKNLGAETPLMTASRLGYADIVWGFVQCAKQTNTNLQTGKSLNCLSEFLGYTDSFGRTALHVAAGCDHYGVVVELLKGGVSMQQLVSYRDNKGKTPLSLLRHPKYDSYIFYAMEVAAEKGNREVVDQLPSTSILIDVDKHQVIYTECAMTSSSYPMSHENEMTLSLNKLDKGMLELTPKRNTILHLLARFGDVTNAKRALQICPTLVYHRNSEEETPLYIAAREGHIDILDILINYVKHDEMEELATRSIDKHTALHVAIENHHAGVVFWLVKELPQLANHINGSHESAIYLAVERNYYDIFRLLLDKCRINTFDGPNGETALHAAAIIENEPRYTKDLLQENIDLPRIHDKHGWTPLHYAVYHNKPHTTTELLLAGPDIGYQMTIGDDTNTSAIHIAASRGHCHLMEELMSKCPGSSELTDSKGRNILHVAIENKKVNAIIWILTCDTLATLLSNQRDINGNTPVHLYMASDLEILQMEEMVVTDRVNIHIRNNDNLTPLNMAHSVEKSEKLLEAFTASGMKHTTEDPQPRELPRVSKQNHVHNEKESKKQLFYRLADSVVLLVTLIATATFAAAFTVPGGFDGNEGSKQGMPILLKKAAYKAFVVSNALAFSCSCCVLFGYIRLQVYAITFDEADEDEKKGFNYMLWFYYLLALIAMISMAVAFITGSYVILSPSLSFAISVCTTCLLIMLSMSAISRKNLRFAAAVIKKIRSIFNRQSILSWRVFNSHR